MAVKQRAAVAELEHAEVRIPVMTPDPATYIARETGHIDMYLRGDALDVFRRVHAGLIEAGAKFASGKPIASKADVIQYLFEQAIG